jgi:hypothetical protein
MLHYFFGLMMLLLTACSQTDSSSSVAFEALSTASNAQAGQHQAEFLSAGVLFAQQAKHEMVDGAGRVVRLLDDDNKGARHQRFIVQIAGGQTLLFAHNIDLALRIDTLKVDDQIEFRGEYSYNPKGGVVHWTHLDSRQQHEAGWIKHNGITYQ